MTCRAICGRRGSRRSLGLRSVAGEEDARVVPGRPGPTVTPPAFSRSFSGARWRSSGRNPVAQMIASARGMVPSRPATPSASMRSNIGRRRGARVDAGGDATGPRHPGAADDARQRAAGRAASSCMATAAAPRLEVELAPSSQSIGRRGHPGQRCRDLELEHEADRRGAAADDDDVLAAEILGIRSSAVCRWRPAKTVVARVVRHERRAPRARGVHHEIRAQLARRRRPRRGRCRG